MAKVAKSPSRGEPEWTLERLGSLGHWLSGGTPSMAEPKYWGGAIPWVSPKDMKVSRLWDAQDHVTEVALGNGTRLAPAHALLLVVRGMILAHSFPVARAERALAFNQDIKALVPRGGVDSDFLLWWLQAHEADLLGVTTESTHGTKRMSTDALFGIEVCLPLLPEQRAIAVALSDVDALIGSLDKLIAKKRDLKQAAMQQLLTGATRLPGFGAKTVFRQSEIGRIPADWAVSTLGKCVSCPPRYGINAAAVPLSDRLPTYIRITDITPDGRFAPDEKVSVAAKEAEAYFLHKGDLVFARTGASVGKSYLYRESDGPLVFAGFLIRVAADERHLSSEYLAAYVTTATYWAWVRAMSMRSGQPGINGNEYAQLPLPLPTIEEQTAIAAVLSDMDAELVALEQRRDKTKLLKQGMMQELLTGRVRLV